MSSATPPPLESPLLRPLNDSETRRSLSAEEDEGFLAFGGACGGVADDFRRRAPFCAADYATFARRPAKALSATLFMALATLFSTVALGALIQKQTDARIGLSEYLLMNSCAGVAHALLGAQPLLVLRPTGPITAILGKLSTLAVRPIAVQPAKHGTSKCSMQLNA